MWSFRQVQVMLEAIADTLNGEERGELPVNGPDATETALIRVDRFGTVESVRFVEYLEFSVPVDEDSWYWVKRVLPEVI